MARQSDHRACGFSRRGFFGLASTAAGLFIREAWAGSRKGRLIGGDPALLSPFEREHFPSLSLPPRTRNGAKVPIVVEMSHPMTPDHQVTSLEVVNGTDPIPGKGRFHFTPGNGAIYVAFQARMDEGDSEVTVTADCHRHGRWHIRRRISIPEGAGGCAGEAPAWGRVARDDIHSPEVRIPEQAQRGRDRRGEVISPHGEIRHPNRTGLAEHDGSFVRASEPLYLEKMEGRFGGEAASKFEFTPALSDGPVIPFA